MPPSVRRPTQPSDLDQIVADTAARVADATMAALRSMFSESFIRGVIEREAKIAVQAAFLAEAERIRINASVTMPPVIVASALGRSSPETTHGTDRTTPLAYRPKKVAIVLGVSLATVYELISDGVLSARKLGGATVILHADLEAYLASLPLTAAAMRAGSRGGR